MIVIPAMEMTRLSASLGTTGPSTARWRTGTSLTREGAVGGAGGYSRLADRYCSPAASRSAHGQTIRGGNRSWRLPPSSASVGVDLILDIGNSRTCGVL